MTRLRERGAAAVELALVLPVLLLIVAAIIDFGRAMFVQSVLTNAAREGARAAVVQVAPADIEARAKAALGPYETSPNISVVPNPGTGCTGTGTLEVEVTVAMDPFDWFLLGPATNFFGGLGLPTQLSSSATMWCGG